MIAAAAPLEGLARTAVLYGGALTVWLVARAALRRPPSIYQQGAAALLWLSAAAVAVAHAIGVLRHGAGHDVPVTLAYAGVAVAVLPVLWPRGGLEGLGSGAELDDGAAPNDRAAPNGGAAVDDEAELSEVRPGETLPASATWVAALAVGVTVVLVLRLGAVW